MDLTQEPYASRLRVLEQTKQVVELQTIIRCKNVTRSDFIFNSDRLIRLLVEEGLNLLPYEDKTITTPTGAEYEGVGFVGRICGVSIMRAGEAMERALRDCCRNVRIGKILIQKDESTNKPQLYYAKFPPDIHARHVLLMDPVLATGGTVCKAIEVLKENGVNENRILFLNLISSPEGVKRLLTNYPEITVVSVHVDDGLDDEKFVFPGIGDFGERYFGTGIED